MAGRRGGQAETKGTRGLKEERPPLSQSGPAACPGEVPALTASGGFLQGRFRLIGGSCRVGETRWGWEARQERPHILRTFGIYPNNARQM